MSEKHQRRRPGRERLLVTMDNVFYRDGIASTSIEDLLIEAGVARGTLYKNFPTRDELLDAYLQRRHDTTLGILSEIIESGVSLSEKIDAIFDSLLKLAGEDIFRGCAFVVAAAELPDEGRPPMRWARRHKRAVRDQFQKLFDKSAEPQSELLAERLSILYDGALVSAFLRPGSQGVDVARDMAKQLLSQDIT